MTYKAHCTRGKVTRAVRNGFGLAFVALCCGQVGAQNLAASNNVDLTNEANQQVLRSWQLQSGQGIPFGSSNAVTVDPVTGKPTVGLPGSYEFHGQVELGGYQNRVSSPTGNPALGSMRSGSFGKTVFQGDVRSMSAEQDVTYAQGTFTSTDDRGLQARYATQINNLQIGRSGAGYQIALGDVAASFSTLSSNLGLRGALLSKDLGAFTATGFAGVVADSWEALASQSTLDGQPVRTRNLRNVVGFKVDTKATSLGGGQISAYATLQNYRDRAGTASAITATTPPQPLGAALAPLTTLEGTVASLGAQYQRDNLQLTGELATSKTQDVGGKIVLAGSASQSSAAGNALIIDATYKLGDASLRAGHHNLEANFTSLAQSITPGVRETYLGSDWQITPQLLWGVDGRTAVTRTPAFGAASTGGVAGNSISLNSLSNRLSYSLADYPGLVFSLLDTRNQGQDALQNDNRNDSTQVGASYANADWSANVLIGLGHTRNDSNAAYNSNNQNWQVFVGRNWRGANLTSATSNQVPLWTFSLQGTAGQQKQNFVSAGSSQSFNAGFNLQASHAQLGSLNASWQVQTSTQPVAGAPRLRTNTYGLDWSREWSPQFTAKAYAKVSQRNHGDTRLQYDERVIGVLGIYKW